MRSAPALLFLTMCFSKDAMMEQCWQGATFSETVVSPNLKEGSILRVPDAPSLAQCAGACCDLLGCDLAWLFERRCYVLSCLRRENCQPRPRPGTDSHVVFLQRSSPETLVLQSLVRGQPFSSHWKPLPKMKSSSPLKDLGFDNVEYAENYRSLEDDGGVSEKWRGRVTPVKAEQKEGLGFLDWPFVVEREGYNTSGADTAQEQSSLNPTSTGLLGEHVQTTDPHPTDIPSLEEQNDGEPSQNRATAAVEPTDTSVTTDSISPNQTLASLSIVSNTPPQQVKPLQVWVGDPIQVQLPQRAVQLEASVIHDVPTAEADPDIYTYDWSIISSPDDHNGVIERQNDKSVKLAELSTGLYVVQVCVTGDHSYGEGLVNISVQPAAGDSSPTAVVIPKDQDVLLPSAFTIIDGSQSTDDVGVVSYHWEVLKGPQLRCKVSTDMPVLRLFDLVPGVYSFRLTVTDTDGLTNSTLATVRVTDPADIPIKANVLPKQANTNQVDQNQNISFLWTLSPQSKATTLTMKGATSPSLQLSGLQTGQYTFQLSVTVPADQGDATGVVSVQSAGIHTDVNRAPVAMVGPDRDLTFPLDSVVLDGTGSSDDLGIVAYRWTALSGPAGIQITDADKPVAVVTGFIVGSYTFQLTVEDQQGETGNASLNISVREGRNFPLVAHTGGSHTLILPNNSVVLRGVVSGADPASISYLWVRDSQSPAAGDVLYSSDQQPSLYLANLVEGTYLFQLRVIDSQGRSSSDTASVEVLPDPWQKEQVQLQLQVPLPQVNQQQKETLLRQLAGMLHVQEDNIHISSLHAGSDISNSVLQFSVRGHAGLWLGQQVAQRLQSLLLIGRKERLLFRVLQVETSACLLHCSGHGHCDPLSKRCICEPFWMENPVRRLLQDGEDNCDWSMLYVTGSCFVGLVLIMLAAWVCLSCCKRRKRTKIRKKTKYTILDNMDEQERMELRPKYTIKHKSTEHNSSLMMSESEFESEQDTIFSRERPLRGRSQSNGVARNGVAFSTQSVDG